MAGLQGVGKTTACGKLALYLRKQKKSVLMVATDVYRPAAIDQLVKLGKAIDVPVFELGELVGGRRCGVCGRQAVWTMSHKGSRGVVTGPGAKEQGVFTSRWGGGQEQ